MATRAELREELIKAGIRPSVQRLAIFEYVRQSCEHPTAEVVYEALCDASPLFRLSMKGGVVKPEPYVKEPYPVTEAEVRERERREAKLKEERLKAEFAAFAERMRQKMPVEAHPEPKKG